MAPPLEISIPTTTLSSSSDKSYTLYNITLRLPLRTFIVQKRYSEFDDLDKVLKEQCGAPPPVPIPAKSWPLPFMRTSTDPKLVEERREGLERYLRAIAESPDRRWRDTSVWRSFLNLPSSTSSMNSSRAAQDAHASITDIGDLKGGGKNLDSGTWLDVSREAKTHLHDARVWLGKRDSANTAKDQHEASANAKRSLVKAGGLIIALEDGLKALQERKELGDGEVRRRRDLVNSMRVEREGLEKLAASLALKSSSASTYATSTSASAAPSISESSALLGPNVSRPKGRVLGGPPVPETAKTRELDNEGVLQLQKQMMQDQDLDVGELAKIVRRQKEMGIAIHEELELQNEMLQRVDEDVDRVKGKIDVAKKRAGKIR
jgi:regulator of vacuolar morphogenesis